MTEATDESEATVEPEVTEAPEAAVEPEAPEATVEPEAAEEPEAAVEPEAAEETAAADEPAAAETPAAQPTQGDVETPKSNRSVVAIAVLSVLLVACIGCLAWMLLRSPKSGDPADTTAPAQTVDVAKAEAFPDGFDFGAIDLDEYIKLGDYDGITVALTTSSEITEKDVADYVANVLAQNTFTVNVDRPAQNGDVLIIDYAGSIDGELFEGGLAQDQEITLGAGGFIPGFEDGIVGMRAGETKTVTATFPQDYGVDELNGKAAQFEITVSSVAEKRDPEYTDEFVKEVLDFDSIEAYEEYVRGVLADQRAQTIDSEKQSAVLTRISGGATVLKYPEGLAESYAAQQIASARSYADMYGVDYDTSGFIYAKF